MKNANEPAFARPYSRDEHSGDRPESHYPQDGLTKREYFAAIAMQGILSNSAESDTTIVFIKEQLGISEETKYVYQLHYPMYVAKIAAEHADALLKQLEITP